MEKHEKNGLSIASLVLGIIGIAFSFIPIINNAAFVFGVIGIVFGIIALIKKAGKGKAIAGLILGILTIIITIALQNSWSSALDEVSNEFDKMAGGKTEEVLKKDIDVTLGKFEVKKDEFGLENTKLKVTLKNKSNKTQNFSVKVEAKDQNGKRIATDDAYFDTVANGQTVTADIFEFVESEKVALLQNATFEIIEASAY